MTERRHVSDKRSECWNRAFRAYATAYLFERRAAWLRNIKRFFTFLGILVPAAIGIIAQRFYSGAPIPSWIMNIASVLAVVLFLFSLISLVTRWDDTQSDAIQAAQKNYTLQTRWEELAKESEEALESKFESLSAEDAKQGESDVKQHVTDREKRVGMHAALFKYQRQCAGVRCDRQPSSLAAPWWPPLSKRCGVCGEPMPKVKI